MNGISRKVLSFLMLAVLISAAAACGSPNTAQTAQADSASSESPSATVSSSPMSMPSPSDSATASAVPTTDPSSPSSPSASAEVSSSPSATKEPAASKDDHHDTVTIEIKDYAFSPSEVDIKPGAKVTFTNRDKVKHTATSDGGEFDTGLIEQDKSKTVTFDKEGTFTFYCSPHPYMTGKIVVKTK